MKPATPIEYIAARSESAYSLPFDVLQYLLYLSVEEKKNLSQVDVHALEGRMLQCPALEKAQVRRLFPDTLVIDYLLKTPVFQIGGVQNLVIDERGDVFRKSPYFPSLHLPIFYFCQAETPITLIQMIMNNKPLFSSCVFLYRSLKTMGFSVEEIDAEEALALGVFRREIRVKVSSQSRNICLRLSVQEPEKLMKRLSLILERFPEYSGIIDLRFPDVAYLE